MIRALIPLLVILAISWPSYGDEDHEDALRMREREEILPLEELLSRLDLGPGARILEIESEREHGRPIYEIEYVDEKGRIREVYVDAATGELLDGED